jgi:hypothetical protein
MMHCQRKPEDSRAVTRVALQLEGEYFVLYSMGNSTISTVRLALAHLPHATDAPQLPLFFSLPIWLSSFTGKAARHFILRGHHPPPHPQTALGPFELVSHRFLTSIDMSHIALIGTSVMDVQPLRFCQWMGSISATATIDRGSTYGTH